MTEAKNRSLRPQDANLLKALRNAQESLEQCEVYYGEANDDSCRALYNRIREMLEEQRDLLRKELASHNVAGDAEETE